jgi:serine/threonine-protein kinase
MTIAKQMFEREGEVLEKLGKHPQIPDLLAFFEVESNGDEFFYLVQEFIDGFTLEGLVQQYGAIAELDVIDIMKSVLPILQFVHENGSIHRDIKPSNIMIRKTDQVYFLLDFGAVKQVTVGAATGLASTGIYTPGYGAPEQMRGAKVYPSSDLYAFGVTCLYLLTGKDPEDLIDPQTNQWRWRSFVQVSPQLGEILDHMIASAPKDRFSSAAEVLQALGAGTSISVPPASQSTVITPVPSAPTSIPDMPSPAPVQVQVPVVPEPMPQPAPARVRPPASKPWLLQVPLSTQLFGAFLLGAQGGLLGVVAHAVMLKSIGVIPTVVIVGGLMLTALALRVFAILDNKDVLVFVNILSILVVGALQFFLKWNLPNLGTIALICGTAGFATVALMTIFRLVFQILFSIL